jgi:hypothetical protein
MTADPEGFFGTRIVSLDYAEGLRLRAPELQNLTARGEFVKAMGDFDRHWFRLVPNAARTKEGVPAYILTPAIERYVQAFPGHRLLAPLVGNAHLPAVAGEDAYLRAAYVPYLTKKASDPETDVGHVDVRIRRSEEEFTPDFVFTAAMNGCAFTVTGSADEESFTAWHYQSPDSNREEASRFRVEQAPSDWFGADEYDSGGHEGLFEVTNIMWRPPGQDGWKIISQEVDVSARDTTDARIRAVRSRDLVLGPGAAVDYTRRIYKASAQTQLEEIEGRINNTRRKFVVDPEPKTFTSLETAVRALIAREEAEFDGAGDLQALGAAALRVKAARANPLEVQMLATSLAKMAHLRVEADLAKFKFRQDPVMQVLLGRRVDDMGRIMAILAKTAWLDELAAEAAARVEADEEEAVPDVVVPDAVAPDLGAVV